METKVPALLLSKASLEDMRQMYWQMVCQHSCEFTFHTSQPQDVARSKVKSITHGREPTSIYVSTGQQFLLWKKGREWAKYTSLFFFTDELENSHLFIWKSREKHVQQVGFACGADVSPRGLQEV